MRKLNIRLTVSPTHYLGRNEHLDSQDTHATHGKTAGSKGQFSRYKVQQNNFAFATLRQDFWE
jgi:hypothetical protein